MTNINDLINEPDVATLRARSRIRRLATPRASEVHTFSSSRWPYTYAYDHVRSRVPEVDSRAEASAFVRKLAEEAQLPKDFVCEMLATACCKEWNITLPSEEFLEDLR